MSLSMASAGFNYADAFVGALLLVGVIGGIKRGLSGEVYRVLSLAAAAFAAWQLTPKLEHAVASATGWGSDVAFLATAGLIVALVLLTCWYIGKLLRKLATLTFSKPVERTGGAILGMLRAAVVAAYFLSLGSVVPHEGLKAQITEGSFCGRFTCRHVTPWIQAHVPMPSPASEARKDATTDAAKSTGSDAEEVTGESLEPLPLLPEAKRSER